MAETTNWYSTWFNSPYYHKLYFERNEQEAELFLKNLIALLKPVAGSRILDVACGRGRHSKTLARMGFDVTGIDLSPASIEYARTAESENLHFYLHDMRLPFWVNFFDYAFNLFTSFGYFSTDRENGNALRTMANSLKPGGTVVIDYLNVHYAEDHLVHKSEIQIGNVNFLITKWFDETHFYKKINIEDDQLNESLEFQEKVAKFNLGDFNDMLAYNNVQVQEVYGDYHFNAYHLSKSPRLVIIGSKKK